MRVRQYTWSKGRAEFTCELGPEDAVKSIGELVEECRRSCPLKRVSPKHIHVDTFGVLEILMVTLVCVGKEF